VTHKPSYEELEMRVQDLEKEMLIRTRADEALRDSEKRYRSLVETSSDWLWEIDADGRYIYASSKVRDIFGYEPEEVVGRTPFDLMPEEEARRVGEIFAQIATERRPFALLENVNLHRDGRRVVLETSGVPVFGPDGEFTGYRGIDRDITERKRTEEALRQSEREKAILNEIANVFLTIPDENIYEEVLAVILKALKCRYGVFGYIGDSGDLIIPSMTKEIWSDCRVEGKSIVFPRHLWGDSLWGKAIKEKKSFSSEGPFQTPEGHLPVYNFLTVPVVFAGKTIGLASGANKDGGFTEEDKAVLERIAVYISPILNTRLQRDKQELERKLAEEALRASEQRLADIIDFLPDATFAINSEGIVIAWNRAIGEMTGVSKESMIGKGNLEYSLPFYGKRRPLMIDLVFAGDEEIRRDYRSVSRIGDAIVGEAFVPGTYGGKGAYLWGIATPLYDKSGKVIAAIESIRDITEHQLAEKEISRQAEFLQLIIDTMPYPVFYKDRQGRYLGCNRAYEQFYGVLREQLAGKTVHEIAPKELADVYKRADDELFTRPGTQIYEGSVQSADGARHDVIFHKATFEGAIGALAGLVGVVEDITERKRAEEELRKSRSELELRVRERTAELKMVNRELRQFPSKLIAVQEEERKRLASELHDSMGQTLAAVKFWVEMALKHRDAGDGNVALSHLEQFVPILQRSIEETRSIYMGLRPTMLDDAGLLATLEWLRQECMKLYPERHIELEAGVAEEEIPESLKVNIFRIAQEALNNIAKHSNAEWVDISLPRNGSGIELVVSDDGVGMDLDIIMQAGTAKSLGLTSMRERAELTGGSFSIESTRGKGTTIRALWPLEAEGQLQQGGVIK
jgi:PAS domain S-box-containing protein